jgi:hypothetical protein
VLREAALNLLAEILRDLGDCRKLFLRVVAKVVAFRTGGVRGMGGEGGREGGRSGWGGREGKSGLGGTEECGWGGREEKSGWEIQRTSQA